MWGGGVMSGWMNGLLCMGHLYVCMHGPVVLVYCVTWNRSWPEATAAGGERDLCVQNVVKGGGGLGGQNGLEHRHNHPCHSPPTQHAYATNPPPLQYIMYV